MRVKRLMLIAATSTALLMVLSSPVGAVGNQAGHANSGTRLNSERPWSPETCLHRRHPAARRCAYTPTVR